MDKDHGYTLIIIILIIMSIGLLSMSEQIKEIKEKIELTNDDHHHCRHITIW